MSKPLAFIRHPKLIPFAVAQNPRDGSIPHHCGCAKSGPAFPMPALWLGVGYCWGSVMSSACAVAGNTAGVELFPTAVRATLGGWAGLLSAIASALSQLLIAALLGPLGGLSRTVAALSVVGLGGAAIFGFFIPETQGIPLELASGKAAAPVA